MLKKLLLLLLFIFYNSTIFSQKANEIGIFGGVSYYTGDVNQDKLFKSVSPAFSFLYKYEINKRYNIRLNLSFSNLTGSDSNADNLYQQTRNHSFSTAITEFAFLFEFNFFPYKSESQFDYFSPYVVSGIGVFISPTVTDLPANPVIPIGIGFKYAFTKKLSLSVEWMYRKTFTDKIDQLLPNEYEGTANFQSKQTSYNGSKDWYSFAGISLTYKFAFVNNSCPAYGH
ncbi:MAG: hypothetical protein JXR51_14490 [Bacteroidales bacterium]|nr:hypothetical protein [Bacteroidales bacterium]MBN2758379.1 hypothetical protein [Bacteroidales bacterium]